MFEHLVSFYRLDYDHACRRRQLHSYIYEAEFDLDSKKQYLICSQSIEVIRWLSKYNRIATNIIRDPVLKIVPKGVTLS